MVYVIGYFIIASIFILLNAFISGFNGVDISKKDIYGSLIWPIELMVLIGGIIRVLKEKSAQNKKVLKKDKNGK
jgi:TRAP-type mannitol/chloroaromatic compound transport system permease small subunit